MIILNEVTNKYIRGGLGVTDMAGKIQLRHFGRVERRSGKSRKIGERTSEINAIYQGRYESNGSLWILKLG